MILVRRDEPIIRLMKVGQTDSRRTWIFTFADPRHKFMQSVIVMKDIPSVAEVVEHLYEKIWQNWTRRIKENSWKTGNFEVLN